MKLDTASRQELMKDARYQDIGNMPSNFFPYTFKNLFIRPFTVKELKLVSKAGVMKDDDYLIRAVDMCISEDVLDLTQGDYYYVLMWLRINSSPKTPYAVTWKCPESYYQNKTTGDIIKNDKTFAHPLPEDADKFKIVKCDTSNTEMVHMTTLNIIQLPEDNWEPLAAEFDFPRVRQIKEVKELLEDPELRLLLPAAQWVRGATIADKIKFLEEQPNSDMLMEALALENSLVHGIEETCTLHCRTCRSEHPFTINLEPLSFFR
jgi:hypothetical protein